MREDAVFEMLIAPMVKDCVWGEIQWRDGVVTGSGRGVAQQYKTLRRGRGGVAGGLHRRRGRRKGGRRGGEEGLPDRQQGLDRGRAVRSQRLGGGGITRVVAVGELPRLICPYCQSTNVAAGGKYVCRDCGTVLGPVLMPPRQPPPTPLRHAAARYRLIMALEREDKRNVRRRYSEIVKMHLGKIAEALGAEVAAVALEMFRSLDRRVYQGRSPRVVAASLAYIAAERLGIYVHKRTIAEILNVSKFSIRDTATRLRRHLQAD